LLQKNGWLFESKRNKTTNGIKIISYEEGFPR
jgi:hypothetical protein